MKESTPSQYGQGCPSFLYIVARTSRSANNKSNEQQGRPQEAAQIAELLNLPSEQAAALRWVLRGLSVEEAVAKMGLNQKRAESNDGWRRSFSRTSATERVRE